jgi:hypothetical protein
MRINAYVKRTSYGILLLILATVQLHGPWLLVMVIKNAFVLKRLAQLLTGFALIVPKLLSIMVQIMKKMPVNA